MIGESKNPWQERYRDKTRTPEEAVSVVRPGQHVFVGSGAAEPQTLVEALSACANITDTEIVHILTLGVAFLKRHPKIAGEHVGLIGHSEGGTIASLAAAASPDLAFIIMLASPGPPGAEYHLQY